MLLFVHGGGFVRGDKTTPDSPFYDNVALLAARNGIIGANDDLSPGARASVARGQRRRQRRGSLAARERVAADLRDGAIRGRRARRGLLAREHSAGKSEWNPAGGDAGLRAVRHRHDGQESSSSTRITATTSRAALSYARWRGRPVPLMVITAELDPADFPAPGREAAGSLGGRARSSTRASCT